MQVLLMSSASALAETRPQRLSDTYQWQKKWRMDAAKGHLRTTGPAQAQAHVQALVANYGVSVHSIADAAGVGPQIISELKRGVCRGMKVTTERRILAIQAADIFNRPNANGSVPAIGARRRLQALMVMGWRHQDLAPMAGFRTANLNHQPGDWISKQKHEAVKELYDRIWNVQGPAGKQSLTRIAKAGYAPPLAWDDDTIDNPNAVPDLGARVYAQGRAPEGATRHADAMVEDAQFLLDGGCTWLELVDRLDCTAEALERLLYRAGRGDLVSRAKSMTERLAYARAS
jgi:hypothetical protein